MEFEYFDPSSIDIDKVGVIEAVVTEMLDNTDESRRTDGYIHLFGVADMAVLLAKKRNLSTDLARIIGLLHDFYYYQTGDREKHASKGGDMLLPMLAKTGLFTVCEIGNIALAVASHSDKDKTGSAYEELIKDADVLQHAMANGGKVADESHKERYEKLMTELHI